MMSGEALGDAIRAAVDAALAIDVGDRQAVFRAIGTAIVVYLQTSATVTGTATGAVGGGLGVPVVGGLV